MEKTYRFRIEPNAKQQQLIIQNFGCCRFVYNYYLNNRIINYQMTGEIFNFYDCCSSLPFLKKRYPWLCDADSTSLQAALKDLDHAFQNFFRGCMTGKYVGYPHFKRRHDHKQKYTTKNNHGSIALIDGKHIKLPKLGTVYCRISRQVEGRILRATIEMSLSGKFYVAICCTDVDVEPLPETGNKIGIDLGIQNLVTDSNGNKYPNNKYIKRYEKKLAIEQRKLARKTKGSKRWEKQRIKVAKIYEKIANMRRDYHQKLTTQLIRENDVICMEDLNPKGMIQNSYLAKLVADASFGEIKRELKYKAEWYGRTIGPVDRFFPSSQICSRCGYQNEEMIDLSKRTFVCPICGLELDRDTNASINIKNEGLRILNNNPKL